MIGCCLASIGIYCCVMQMALWCCDQKSGAGGLAANFHINPLPAPFWLPTSDELQSG